MSLEENQKVWRHVGGSQEFLRIHTYLTQEVEVDTIQNIVLNSSTTAVDPLTRLQARTNYGRPDFTRLLSEIRLGISDGTIGGSESGVKTKVGVFFCGKS